MTKIFITICSMFFISIGVMAQDPDTLALANTKLIRNIPYVVNGHKLQNFDLYIPKDATKPMPVLLWIHGGAWEGGLKKWIDAAYLINSGYAIASIDYRFSDTAIFPAQVQDCNEAMYKILTRQSTSSGRMQPNTISTVLNLSLVEALRVAIWLHS